jgi:cell division protein FtsQ
VLASPIWVLRRADQVKVVGNRFISTQAVRSSLPIDYPQSLLRVEPRTIAAALKTRLPLIEEVTVDRQLFPLYSPSLTVQLKERYPVAIAVPPSVAEQNVVKPSAKSLNHAAKIGLIDEQGEWIPLESYTEINQPSKLPTLRIIGNLEQYRPYWSKLYQAVSRSPIKISEIDGRDPANLILKTELGMVYIGAYGPQFSYQLTVLDKLRKLPSQANFRQIAYLDLRNPNIPIVQMIKPKDPVKPKAE